MGENPGMENQFSPHIVFDVPGDVLPRGSSNRFNDDGHLKELVNHNFSLSYLITGLLFRIAIFFETRQTLASQPGTLGTATVPIIIALLASDIQSLGWTLAQLGWVAGTVVMLLFSFVIYYTTTLLAACYRRGDPITGRRNYMLADAVITNLGGAKFVVCGLVQFFNLFGVATACTIASTISMMEIERSTSYRITQGKDAGPRSINPYVMAFGVAQITLSQIPDLDQSWLLSVVATVMSIINSTIGLALAVAKVAVTRNITGSLTGISFGTGTQTQKMWRSFQALGNIAFGFSYSITFIEIQETHRSPLSDVKIMKRASLLSVAVINLLNMLCGCMDYAAFGDNSPLSGSSHPYWPLDVANFALVIHLLSAYQVCCQPLFAFIEKNISTRFPDSEFITKDVLIPNPFSCPYKLNLFRLVWRTTFVITTTVMSMLVPFINDVVGLVGALGFWPLTVYFPVEMFIVQKKIQKWSPRWLCLQILSMACLIVTIAAAAGSVAGVVHDLKSYKLFKTPY